MTGPVAAKEAATVQVAVAIRENRKVAGHIGKCANWIVFDVAHEDAGSIKVHGFTKITLPRQFVFHHYKDDAPHPLGACAAVIGASAGDSFAEKMRGRGIEVVLTAEPDPMTAVADYLRHASTPPKPRPIGSLICKLHDALSS